jgi:hypothetical protein
MMDGSAPAQIALRHEMARISEREYPVGWYAGLEEILWDRVSDQTNQTDDVRVLRWLSKQAKGWWCWDDVIHDVRFVPDSEAFNNG